MRDKEQRVVLKILNTQNIAKEILREISCNKEADTILTTNCFGISQDPQTKNYIMVIDYIEGGNLRQHFLQKASFWEKIGQLMFIAKGLADIHEQDLIHCDF